MTQPKSVGHTVGQSTWGLDETRVLRGEREQPGGLGQREHRPTAEIMRLCETHLLTCVSTGRGEPGPVARWAV